MRKVLIGTPAHSGQVDAWYANALFYTERLCTSLGIDLRPIIITGDSNLCNARNDLVAIAIREGFDDLIFIDADQDWKPEFIPRLLSHPVDCVGAAIRKKLDAEELYNVRAPDGPLSFVHNREAGLWTAPGMTLGTGLLRVSRDALQALWDDAEPYQVKGKAPSRWIFDFRPIQGELVGEDVLLCMKLQAMGVDVWLDPTMTVGHVGTKKWTGDFANWLGRAQEQERARQSVPQAHPKAA
jgi:hypothetical protein